MNVIDELLIELNSRLPELEWKISGLTHTISTHHLPKGLFRFNPEHTALHCVEEIKADIQALSQQKNERCALYLAERMKQKINVLVTLCQLNSRKNKPREKIYFGVKTLSTRQQWIHGLENDINTLVMQQQSMLKAFEQLKKNQNTTAILSLQAELGEVDRRLTLAKETLTQAVL